MIAIIILWLSLNIKEAHGHVGQIDQILSLELALKQGKVKDGDVVCMIAAGIGYAWAANIIRWG